MGQINLYTAVEEMKAVSKAEGTFSIKFRKYNRQKQSGGDLVFLKAARLRSKASDEKIEKDIEKHISTIAMAVVDLKMKEGAEGETSHSENSTSRTYENAYISSSIFKDVLPYVDTF